MKKLLLTTVTMFGLTLFLCAQTTLVTQVPQISNGNSTLRAPNGTAAHTSLRAHFLLTATELASVPSGNNITQLGFVLNNGIASGASNGTLKLYLEATSDVTNTKSTTWTTAVASMTEVYNSTYTIPISATATNIDLVLALPFAYTGTGLYVAYEYVAASTSTTPANYASNTDLASGLKMIDGTTTTPGATLTGSSSFRPCMRIGIPNPNSNDVEVRGILSPVGKVSSAIQSSQDIVAIIGNASNTALTNVPVTMSVSGPNPSSTIQTIASIAAGQEVNVTFSGLATTSNTIQTVSISVPNDDDNSDNLLLYDQSISCDTIGYYNTDGAFGAVGYNTGSGCLANRHVIPNTTPVTIKSIGMVLNDDNVAVGNTMKGILFNSQGLPIDSSNLVTLTTAMLGNRVAFDLIHADSNLAGDTVFIGVL